MNANADWRQRHEAEMKAIRASIEATNIRIAELQEQTAKILAETAQMKEKNKTDLKCIIKKLEGYIKHDSDGIEAEMNMAVKKYLITKYRGMKLFLPETFPKVLKDPITNEMITDLDGVFLLTNDPQVEYCWNPVLPRLKVLPTRVMNAVRNAEKERRLIAKNVTSTGLAGDSKFTPKQVEEFKIVTKIAIIEAKHNVQKNDVKEKLEQMQVIKEYIQLAKRLHDDNLTDDERSDIHRQFRENVNNFKYYNYDENIALYIGGPKWSQEALDFVNTKFQEKPELKQNISIVKPNGSRYGIADVDTLFELQGGDAKKKVKTMTKKSRHIKQ